MEILLCKCSCCNNNKPIEEMVKDRHRISGIRNICLKCYREKSASKSQEKVEADKAARRKWIEKNKDYKRERQKFYRRRNRAIKNGIEFKEEFNFLSDKKHIPTELEIKEKNRKSCSIYREKNKALITIKAKLPENRKK